MDQRSFIQFLKTKIKCARAFEMWTVAFGESTMSTAQVQLWYNRFKQGREDVNDDVHSPWSPKHLNNRFKYLSSEENDFRQSLNRY